MTTLETAPVAAPSLSLRPAARVAFGLLIASQLAILVFTLWEPAFDGTIRYADIAPLRDSYWPMNVLLGGPGYALGTVTASLFLALLGPGRGNRLALTGTVVHLLAGLVFALVITAEVLPFAWAADPAVVGDRGPALFDSYNDHFDAFLPYVLGSMALVALGALLALTGAAVSGNLSWWVVAAAVGIVVAIFALPLGSPFGFVANLAQHALWVWIGWCGLRRA